MFVGWEDGKWGNSRGHWMKQMNWMASSTSDEPSRILTCDWNASYGFMKRTLTAADKGLRAPDCNWSRNIFKCVCTACLQQLTGSRRGSRGKSKHFIGYKCNVKKLGFSLMNCPVPSHWCIIYLLFTFFSGLYLMLKVIRQHKNKVFVMKNNVFYIMDSFMCASLNVDG